MEVLDCILCSEGYDYLEHIPRTLKCGHTYCTNCLVKVIMEEDYARLYCPICRHRDRPYSELKYRLYCANKNNKPFIKVLVECYFSINDHIFRLFGNCNEGRNINQKYKDGERSNFVEQIENSSKLRLNVINCEIKSNLSNDKLKENNNLDISKSHTLPSVFCDKISTTCNFPIEFIDNKISLIDNMIQENIICKSHIELEDKLQEEEEIQLNQWLHKSENDMMPMTKICKTIEDFQDMSRWSSNTNKTKSNKDLKKEVQSLQGLEDPSNVDVMRDIVENLFKVVQKEHTVHTTYTDDISRQEWQGHVTARDGQYYINAMTPTDTPNVTSTIQVEHFLLVKESSETVLSLHLNLNDEQTCSVILQLNCCTSTRLLDNLIWMSTPIEVHMLEKADNLLLTMKTSIQSREEQISLGHLNPLGVVCLNDRDQLEIIMTNNKTSNISQPIGRVISGMSSLRRVCKVLANNESVSLVNTEIIVNSLKRQESNSISRSESLDFSLFD